MGERKGAGHYTYDEITFLNTIAKALALAIENTKIYTDLKKRTTEIEEANRVKSDFLNIVSHELKTPLTTIVGQIGLFREGALGQVSGEQAESLQKIEDKSFRLNPWLQTCWI